MNSYTTLVCRFKITISIQTVLLIGFFTGCHQSLLSLVNKNKVNYLGGIIMKYSIIMDLKPETVNELITIINDAVDTACGKAYGDDKTYGEVRGTVAEPTANLIVVTSMAADIKNWLLSNNKPSGYGLAALSYMLFELKARLKMFNVKFNYKEVFSLERSY